MASPTPFFAESANKSDGEHYAEFASCPDHSGDANKMVAPDHPPGVAARDIFRTMGYAKWETFNNLILRCKGLIAHGVAVGEIQDTTRPVKIGSGATRDVIDYYLDAKALELVGTMSSAFKLNGAHIARNETSALFLVKKWFERKGIECRPQAKVGGFVPDLLIGETFAVEIDEPHHNESRFKRRDALKDQAYRSLGLTPLRFTLDEDAIDIITAVESHLVAGNMVSAAVPNEEDVARVIAQNPPDRSWEDCKDSMRLVRDHTPTARAVLALFAPALAEKERRIREMAMQALADDQQLTASLDRALAAEAALAKAIVFELGEHHYVESRGDGTWAIKNGGCVLNVDGVWEYEPSPSNRTDEFIARTRFDLEDAFRRAAAIRSQEQP